MKTKFKYCKTIILSFKENPLFIRHNFFLGDHYKNFIEDARINVDS